MRNFYPDRLTDNQLECHPFLPCFDFEENIKKLGVTTQSWGVICRRTKWNL
ncbi:hypothetical protein [Helicobacter ibis]|uniref:Uncharacterized protein n=1 Tax=Helicobacter ibis TaxID=2962633 RepID=A0ABT4VD67_9HELI|nr:hypothetical protein [Helicobacter ibis]MDA3968647.1 hypothetical protein [Helicobacter ibis]